MVGSGELRKRVYLYITRGDSVLVLRHVQYPDLGLQIPGGTVDVHEAPLAAAGREAFEETGLVRLGPPKLLGHDIIESQRRDEMRLEAWFFQLDCLDAAAAETWRHVERHASGTATEVLFELSWITRMDAARCLGAADRSMLHALG